MYEIHPLVPMAFQFIILTITILVYLKLPKKEKPYDLSEEITPDEVQGVNFHGLGVRVPTGYNYLAMDADGELVAYVYAPLPSGLSFSPDEREPDNGGFVLLNIPFHYLGIHWAKSLVSI